MDPEKAAFMQMQIRNNASDLQDYLKGLESWEDNIKEKDATLSKQKPILKEKLPPVRGSQRQKKKKSKPVKVGLQTEPRIKSYDFKAWDKFDVDKACEDVDYQVESTSSSEEEEEDNQEQQRKQQAVLEKEKGNELFKQGKHEMAVECYSRAAELDPLNAVMPANRAMALLKLERYAAVESDCSLALSLDDCYLKAYLRRGTARLKLGKLEEAREDFEAVLRLEPGNKLAKSELIELNKERDRKFVHPVKRPPHLRAKKPLRRITIEDIGEDPSEKPSTPPSVSVTTSSSAHPASTPPSSTVTDSSPSNSTLCTSLPEVTVQSPTVHDVQTTSLKTEPLDSTEAHPPTRMTIMSTEEDSSEQRSRDMTEPSSGGSGVVLKMPPVPENSISLQGDWKRLRRDRKLLAEYFKNIPVSKYPTLLQQSLETDVFSDIISILLEQYVQCGASCLSELQALTQVKRFSVAVMFLSRKDQENLKQLFRDMKSLIVKDREIEQMAKLQKTYGV